MAQEVDLMDMLEKTIAFNKTFLQIEQEILQNHEMNASAINLISIIGDNRMTLTEITNASGLDKSTVSRQINRLVKEELVLKESGEDKRYSFFELSESAK
ncbi:MAG: MarR family transcriptional regulator, partial [Atopostipes sp.]|nr:MarR family transcriptional regulator [Atopostipes sp.]